MDLSAIFQLRTKKFWWMDVIFYLVISLLIAAVLCYVIFLTKNNLQRKALVQEVAAMQTVGTQTQKAQEKSVISYQKKIVDFTNLLKNHEFASNVFAFIQSQTMPNVWFKQFSLDEKNNGVQLSGEADSLDAFSRQVATFEGNKYVNDVGTLNSSIGSSARIEFNINLVLDQKIFAYLANALTVPTATAAPTQASTQPASATTAGGNASATTASTASTPNSQTATTVPSATVSASTAKQSSEKLITSFHLLLSPEVAGIVDETNFVVTLNVPYGTDTANIKPSIVISPGATVLPASGTAQDFTNPVTYRVTAEDGSVQKYTVKVIVASPPAAGRKSGQSAVSPVLIISLVGIVIIIIAVIFLLILRRSKTKE